MKLKGSQASLTDRLPIPRSAAFPTPSGRPTRTDPDARSAAKKIGVGPTDLLSGGVRAPTTFMMPRPTTLTFTPWAVLYPTTSQHPSLILCFFCPAFLPKVSK